MWIGPHVSLHPEPREHPSTAKAGEGPGLEGKPPNGSRVAPS